MRDMEVVCVSVIDSSADFEKFVRSAAVVQGSSAAYVKLVLAWQTFVKLVGGTYDTRSTECADTIVAVGSQTSE